MNPDMTSNRILLLIDVSVWPKKKQSKKRYNKHLILIKLAISWQHI